MKIEDIIDKHTGEDGTVDYNAVNEEIANATVPKEEYLKAEEKAKGAYAAAKAKYSKKDEPKSDPKQPEPEPNKDNEVLSALLEEVNGLKEQLNASATATAVSNWEAGAIAKGVPESTVKNLSKLANGNIESLSSINLDEFIIPTAQSFGAKKNPSAEELATKQEAAMVEFKKYVK